MSLASAEKEHKSSEWVERATPYVHGFTSENGDRREEKSRAWRLEIQISARDGVILNQQHPEMSNENLVQFLQDMYIYTRVVQFQYEVPATLSIKAPPSSAWPESSEQAVEIPPILAPLPTNNLESLEFPALSPRKKKKAVPVV